MKSVREAVILAAGYGLRMRPVTLDFPKPALPFLNRPVIQWILEALEAAGVRRALMNLHHLPQAVREAAESGSRGLDLAFSYEPQILGTAGLFGPLGREIRGDAFLALNGDTLHEFSMERLEVELQSDPDALAVLALRPGSPPYTPVDLSPDGRLLAFGRGPLMFTGAYAARTELLAHLHDPGPSELVRDLLAPLLPSGRIRGVLFPDPWVDLGDPAGFLAASMRAVQDMAGGRRDVPEGNVLRVVSGHPFLLHHESELSEDAEPVGPAVLGKGVRVAAGARLGRSVLLPATALGAGESLESAILSPSGVLPVPSSLGDR